MSTIAWVAICSALIGWARIERRAKEEARADLRLATQRSLRFSDAARKWEYLAYSNSTSPPVEASITTAQTPPAQTSEEP